MKEIRLEEPLVSILMPVYQDPVYVVEAINSIRNQIYQHWELIIVDDGSKDNTPEVVKGCIKDEPRARLFHQSNGGTGSAINRGLEESNGGYLTWCSSDNLYLPNFVSSLLKALQNNPSYHFSYGDFYYVNQNGAVISQVIHKPIPSQDLANGYDLGMCMLYTSELQKKVGNYWGRICEDYDFAVRASRYTEFLLVPEFLAAYRVHGGQITGHRLDEEKSAAEACRKLARSIHGK